MKYLNNITLAFAEELTNWNPRFDKAKFLEAAGYGKAPTRSKTIATKRKREHDRERAWYSETLIRNKQ